MRGAGYVRVSEQYKTVHNFFILQVYVKKKYKHFAVQPCSFRPQEKKSYSGSRYRGSACGVSSHDRDTADHDDRGDDDEIPRSTTDRRRRS